MESGSLQVRVAVTGPKAARLARGSDPGDRAAHVEMDRGLGSLLFFLMVVLAVALVSIAAAACARRRSSPAF